VFDLRLSIAGCTEGFRHAALTKRQKNLAAVRHSQAACQNQLNHCEYTSPQVSLETPAPPHRHEQPEPAAFINRQHSAKLLLTLGQSGKGG